EFHIFRIKDERLALADAAWPAEPPAVALLHPGYQLLSESWADQCDEPLAIVRRTALALGLPLRSQEVELGPSQFEAVFGPTDALAAADHMVLFRNGVRQALRRAGYHASFVCRPPFEGAVASGWHLHHSLVDADGRNAMGPSQPGAEAAADDFGARRWLGDAGAYWLAGLLAHAPGMTALCAPSLNAYSRYRGSVMAPQAVQWGRDNRGALLRLVGSGRDLRIENRLGEPLANPYLAIAAQVWAGLDGVARRLEPPPATDAPYAADLALLPATLAEALDALAADSVLQQGLGQPMAQVFHAIKRQELARHAQADDAVAWMRREYFGRY
ncbi:MAG TPA: glutamine synthetase, partial [Rubrivivax sp.]|nr:glutamine synthetase [Rubrivivax sp.]